MKFPSITRYCRRQLAKGEVVRSWLGVILMILASPPVAAQQYTFSRGPTTAEWIQGAPTWDGRHSFLDVYCAEFPDPTTVRSTSEGLLNGDAISYFRVNYTRPIEAYLITSTIPEGRSESEEFERLFAQEQRNAAEVNGQAQSERYRVGKLKTKWGNVISMRIANVSVQSRDDVFPLDRAFLKTANEPPQSRTSHRMFVRGQSRFEVVAAGVPERPGDAAAVSALEKEVDTLADTVLSSLLRCAPMQPAKPG